MRKTKKLITALLAAAVVVGQCVAPAATAFADWDEKSYYDSVDDCYYYIVNDDGDSVTITEYNGITKEVHIPDTIESKSVTCIGEGAPPPQDSERLEFCAICHKGLRKLCSIFCLISRK